MGNVQSPPTSNALTSALHLFVTNRYSYILIEHSRRRGDADELIVSIVVVVVIKTREMI